MLFEANRQDGVLITYLLKYITKMQSFDYLFDCNKLSNIIEQQTTIIVTPDDPDHRTSSKLVFIFGVVRTPIR